MLVVFLIAILLALPLSAGEAGKGIALYTLADEKIDFGDVDKIPLNDLKLKPEPWISPDDIDFYDASANTVYLKQPRPQQVHSVFGTPYVLVADGERIFAGTLWTSFSSALPREGAAVIDEPGIRTPPDVLQINEFRLNRRDEKPVPPHPMNDPRIKKTLERDGKFHEGLKCVLDKVEPVYDAASRRTAVKYTYTLTNLDKDNLYVLDPEKMGSAKFHYFNNGVYFVPPDDSAPIQARPGQPENAAELRAFNLENFVQLKSGASITRTVALNTYPRILPGPYTAHFMFSAPNRITREQRKQPGGRIWLGHLTAQLPVEID